MPRGVRKTSMAEGDTEAEKKVTKEKKALILGGYKIVPFDGDTTKLPTAKGNTDDKKRPWRFYVNEKGLMMIYRADFGVKRRLMTRIHKSKAGQELRRRLKAAGVPGA